MQPTLKQYITECLTGNSVLGEELMHSFYGGKGTWRKVVNYNLEIKGIDHHGGEGEGRNYWTVLEVRLPDTTETCLIKLYGWYASYDGSYYDGWSFVQPVQVTRTEYV